MDPFEEFEFKPITEGLGFHRKETTKESAKEAASNASAQRHQDSIPSDSASKEFGQLLDSTMPIGKTQTSTMDELLPPLPRKKISDTLDSDTVDEVLKSLKKDKRLDFATETPKPSTTVTPSEKFQVVPFAAAALFLDTLLILSASLICMILALTITKVDLIQSLAHPQTDYMVYVATFGILTLVSFIYLTVHRTFLGYTPGEWAFELRVGLPSALKNPYYPLQAAARSALVIFTGFIVIPVVSWILHQDLAGEVTGLKRLRKMES